MPGKHKAPLLGWHPPAELSAWVRAEALRRGVTVSVVLNEALAAYQLAVTDGRGRAPAVMPGMVKGEMVER